MGTYIHGLFENPTVTRWWLNTIGLPDVETATLEGLAAKDKEYDLLVEHFESHIDVEGLVTSVLVSDQSLIRKAIVEKKNQ